MKKATIRDVAKAAGVSQSTVSRVLNNNGYVGEDARRRVEAGNALPEPERRIFTTHMKPIFERKVTLPKPDAAPTETDEKEK